MGKIEVLKVLRKSSDEGLLLEYEGSIWIVSALSDQPYK